jgi:hypothetical protein
MVLSAEFESLSDDSLYSRQGFPLLIKVCERKIGRQEGSKVQSSTSRRVSTEVSVVYGMQWWDLIIDWVEKEAEDSCVSASEFRVLWSVGQSGQDLRGKGRNDRGEVL